MVFVMALFHALALYGLLLLALGAPQWRSVLSVLGMSYVGGLGITMGHHRLWTHR